MITDSKFVKSVESNEPKKGYVVTWTDDKRDFLFNEEWIDLCRQAKETNRMLTYTKEKNDKGYWTIMSLAFTEAPTQEMTHETVPEGMPPKEELKGTQPKITPNPQELGMWFKEMGNRIGDGSIERDYPKSHISIKSQYYKRMSEVTGIDFKRKEE